MRYCALAICALLVSGCALFGKEDGTEPLELVEFTPSVELESVWRSKTGTGRNKAVVQLQPALDGDAIYAADVKGRVEAFNRFTGKRLWRQKTGEPLTGGVTSRGGLVLFGTSNGEVIALSSSDGEELWRRELSSEVVSVPNTNGSTVVVLTMDGKLHALDAETGDRSWRYENPPPVLTLRGGGKPAVTDSTVYAGFATGKVMAFDVDNGLTRWEHRVALPQGRSELDRMVDVDAAPLLHDDVLYVASYQGKVAALNRSNGRPLWTQDASTHEDMAIAQRTLFLSQANSQVRAFGANSGEIKWQNDQMLRRDINGPQVLGDYVAVGDFDGYLHLMKQSDGEFVARKRIDRKGISASMVSDGETLYVLGNSGRLVALKIAEDDQ